MTILGGGLSGLLTAWRALDVNPDLRVTVIEAKAEVAGDHTWSFNLSDIPPHLRDWIAPLIRHRWPRYEVRFPRRRRLLDIPYVSGDSERLRGAIQPFVAEGRLRLVTGHEAEPAELDGTPWLDARGFRARADEFPGWQKFVGHVIRTQAPHGLDHPVLMDATVEQIDGYRFVYCLPYSDRELLVEDTYFSDDPHLSDNAVGARLADYIAAKGWGEHTRLRTERGVLPMMMATDRADLSPEIGLRGGFAIAATGFTVPAAVGVADRIAERIRERGLADLSAFVSELRGEHIRRERFARLLNRMFFRAAEPGRRYAVLQRFYGLAPELIRRFYRNALRPRDKLRILIGKPPVPVTKALYHFGEKAFIARRRNEDSR